MRCAEKPFSLHALMVNILEENEVAMHFSLPALTRPIAVMQFLSTRLLTYLAELACG